MRKERERVLKAVELAEEGKEVALVSSGDAGVYGMAGLAIETTAKRNSKIHIEIIPGVSAANSASALLGAPLMLDYAVISLSNLLVPLEQIEKRLRATLSADMVLAIYNPKSKSRTEPFELLCKLLKEYRQETTPVGIATAIGLPDEHTQITTVKDLHNAEVTMQSTVIIGNSTSRIDLGLFHTPRGY